MIKYMNTSEDYLTTGSPACDNRPNNNICFLQHIQLSKYTPHSSMDKLSRLQKLLGDGDAVTDTSAFDALTLGSGVKAHHLYEGSSDSEDGVLRMDAVVVEPKVNKSKKSKGKKSTNEVAAQPVVRSSGKPCTKHRPDPCVKLTGTIRNQRARQKVSTSAWRACR